MRKQKRKNKEKRVAGMNRQLFSLFTGKVVDSVRTFLVKKTLRKDATR